MVDGIIFIAISDTLIYIVDRFRVYDVIASLAICPASHQYQSRW